MNLEWIRTVGSLWPINYHTIFPKKIDLNNLRFLYDNIKIKYPLRCNENYITRRTENENIHTPL